MSALSFRCACGAHAEGFDLYTDMAAFHKAHLAICPHRRGARSGYTKSAADGIGGKALREAIGAVMQRRPAEPIHYSDVHQLVEQEFGSVRGADPKATLLTQLVRTPGVWPEGKRSGVYVFRPEPHATTDDPES